MVAQKMLNQPKKLHVGGTKGTTLLQLSKWISLLYP
jgi:hypothetical protein